MSNSKFSIGNLSGKGLLIAVGASVLVVGAAGFYSYSRISDKLNAEIIGANKDTFSASADSGNKTPEPNSPANASQSNIFRPQTEAPSVTEAPKQEKPMTDGTKETKTDSGRKEIVKPEQQSVMVRPLNGEVISDYSGGELVKSKTLNVWKTHDGVDIAGAVDEKVKSITSGTVTKVYEDRMMGVCVTVDHGSGLEAYYCNLGKDVAVAEGQNVSAGTVIGAVGNTAEGEIGEEPHLHFAVKKNGEWIDPIALISGEGS